MNSREKGRRGEIEIIHELEKYGYKCRRAQGMYCRGGVETPDVVGLPGIHMEIKRVENLNIHKAYAQAVSDSEGKAIPAVFHRRNRGPWMVTLGLNDFMRIYKNGER